MSDDSQELALTSGEEMDLLHGFVTKGDVSGLNNGQLAKLYAQLARSMGMDAATQPFSVLTLQGRKVLYLNRGGADQLARVHGVSREILEGPAPMTVEDAEGNKQKVIFCKARATLPNGRSETKTAFVPVPSRANAEAISNAYMKAETKAARRATIAIVGIMGIMDETEAEDAARAQEAPLRATVTSHQPAGLPAPAGRQSVASAPAKTAAPVAASGPSPELITKQLDSLSRAALPDLLRSKEWVKARVPEVRAAYVERLRSLVAGADEATAEAVQAVIAEIAPPAPPAPITTPLDGDAIEEIQQ